jgi:archaemetzincin
VRCKEEDKEGEKMSQAETICLAPVGEVEEDILFFLRSELEKVFFHESFGEKEVKIAESLEHPDYAYNPEREQYLSSEILEKIKKANLKGCDRVLGIADVDLYVPSLNFVLGQADFYDKVAVISLTRLRQEYYDLPEDEKLFKDRALKESVHELGHTYGLTHCSDPKCVMYFSNSLKDTDIKSHNFCSECKYKLNYR